MIRAIGKLRRLSLRDWLDLPVAYWWLLRARSRMRRFRGSGWLAERQGMAGGQAPRTVPREHIQRRVRLIDIASRHPFHWSLCLQNSVALQDWLRQEGVYPALRIGVRKWDGQLFAHAWLELDGWVLNDGPHVSGRFVPLPVQDLAGPGLMELR